MKAQVHRRGRSGGRPALRAPAPDVLVSDLAEEIRQAKRHKLRPSSFASFEYALDKIILPELGRLSPAQAGPDRIASLISDLQARGFRPSTIRRYISPLGSIFKLAIRRGLVASNPLALLSEEERPAGGGIREHHIWTGEELSALIDAADDLGRRPEAQYNYAPLIRLLALTGLRISEALGLRWGRVDLSIGELHVTSSWSRDGALAAPKTRAAMRCVPLAPELVQMLARIKPEGACAGDFVFASSVGSNPIAYWNFRRRGFKPALRKAGLDSSDITIHDLRSAAASIMVRQGLTAVEVAQVLGHADPNVTLRVYARLFDRQDFAARVRKAQGAALT